MITPQGSAFRDDQADAVEVNCVYSRSIPAEWTYKLATDAPSTSVGSIPTSTQEAERWAIRQAS
jgi:hypothetical protein